MEKVTQAIFEYETPQLTTIEIITEQCLAGSTGSSLDDMWETEGEWAGL